MSHRFARFLVALWCVAGLGALMPAARSDDSIATAKEDREEARRQQLEAESELGIIDAEDIEVVEALAAATELVNLQQAKVDAAQQRLDAAREARAQAEGDVTDAALAIELLRAVAVNYAVESYVGLSDSYTEAWFEAEDATTAAHKVALLDTLSSETNDVLDRLRAIEDRRRDLLADAEAAQVEADGVEAELDVALADLEAKRQVQLELKVELDARRAQWEASLAEARREEEELTAFIIAEEERIARELEERRRAAAAAAAAAAARQGQAAAPVGVVNSSGWTWPTSGGVASTYGQRLHPILGYYRMHTGIDVGGAHGQPIWAATEGVVIFAGWNGGYGNSVVIQHANSVSTLYAHMSSVQVSVGDYLFTGAPVGALGSTGLSTGPHLHFEVRIHGSPVDPRPYLP